MGRRRLLALSNISTKKPNSDSVSSCRDGLSKWSAGSLRCKINPKNHGMLVFSDANIISNIVGCDGADHAAAR